MTSASGVRTAKNTYMLTKYILGLVYPKKLFLYEYIVCGQRKQIKTRVNRKVYLANRNQCLPLSNKPTNIY